MNNPKGASTFQGSLDALEVWDEHLALYVACGAHMPPDEDLRHSMLKVIPSNLSSEMKLKAYENMTSDALRDWIQGQADFQEEMNGGKALNIAEQTQSSPMQSREEADDDDDVEEEELTEEAMANMSASEINAFMRTRQNGWQQQRGRGRNVRGAFARTGGAGNQRNDRSSNV